MGFHSITLHVAIRRFAKGCVPALLVLMIGGCGDKPVGVASAVRAVKVETVSASGGEGPRFIGIVRQQESASLAFESAGVLSQLHIDVGDTFEKGQVLAALDRQPATLHEQQAQAGLASATAQAAERGLNLQRQKSLFAAGSVAQGVVEAAQASHAQAEAEKKRAQAEWALARRELDHSQLIAPFAGRVVARRVDPYNSLSAGQVVLEVESRSGQQVMAAVTTAQSDRLRPGDKARAWSTSDPSVILDLVLEGISPRAEDGLTRVCRFRVLNPADPVASGITLLMQMSAQSTPQPLSIPVQALWMGTGRNTAQVFVYQSAGTVVIRNVSLGAISDGRAVVNEGLSAGEQIVTAGAAFLQDGQTVSLFQPATRLSETTP